eukprot:7386216-Prymnesium_polylepis.2
MTLHRAGSVLHVPRMTVQLQADSGRCALNEAQGSLWLPLRSCAMSGCRSSHAALWRCVLRALAPESRLL